MSETQVSEFENVVGPYLDRLRRLQKEPIWVAGPKTTAHLAVTHVRGRTKDDYSGNPRLKICLRTACGLTLSLDSVEVEPDGLVWVPCRNCECIHNKEDS